MTEQKDVSQDPEVKPLLDEIGKIEPRKETEVAAEIRQIHEAKHLTEKGALSDVVAPREGDTERRRVSQVFAATQSGIPIPTRRDVLVYLLGAGTSFGVGVAATIFTQDFDVEESFLREILRLGSDKPQLLVWRDSLMRNGDTDKALLLSLLTPTGESFEDTFQAISSLEHLLRTAKLTEFSRTYIQRAFSHHHRYLGFHVLAAEQFAGIADFKTEDARLNTLLLNSKHMDSYTTYFYDEDYSQKLSADNSALLAAASVSIGTDISSLSKRSFREARSVSLESAALKGLYFANNVMAASTEPEALEAMNDLDEFSKKMLLTMNDDMQKWRMVREYGEVIWWYGRVAKVAFLKSWDKVLERCLSAFYESNSNTKVGGTALTRQFHEIEADAIRSPVWIQTALICSMRDEIRSGEGQSTLTRLLDSENRHKFRRNTELLRGFNALTVALGHDPMKINPAHSLAAVENRMLIDCVRQMNERLNKVP